MRYLCALMQVKNPGEKLYKERRCAEPLAFHVFARVFTRMLGSADCIDRRPSSESSRGGVQIKDGPVILLQDVQIEDGSSNPPPDVHMQDTSYPPDVHLQDTSSNPPPNVQMEHLATRLWNALYRILPRYTGLYTAALLLKPAKPGVHKTGVKTNGILPPLDLAADTLDTDPTHLLHHVDPRVYASPGPPLVLLSRVYFSQVVPAARVRYAQAPDSAAYLRLMECGSAVMMLEAVSSGPCVDERVAIVGPHVHQMLVSRPAPGYMQLICWMGFEACVGPVLRHVPSMCMCAACVS